jgi:sugar phosphate isomerase/epimerase
MLAEVGTTVLGDAIAQVQADIDSLFDALLPVPDDTSARLVEAMRYAADTVQRAVPTLEECGVTIALEPLGPEEGDFLRTADLGAALMRMIGSDRVRLHLDVKAMSTEEIPICDGIRNHAESMAHFHANDPNRRGPGMGAVDFKPIFQTLESVQYKGWVSVEVFDYTPGPEYLAAESFSYMQECLRAISAR